MNGVEIKPLNLIGENQSGTTLKIGLGKKDEGILAFRKAGSISGRHYHKGDSPGKNPEKLVLMTGVLRLVCRDLNNDTEETYHIRAPKLIEIAPMIWHEVTAVSDISFVELNSLEEHAADTYRVDS